jgi:DNA-binding MarR family transcriptional regulator
MPTGRNLEKFVLLACAWWLSKQGHTPNQLELADQAGTDVKMTSQVLRTLENKGLLERKADPHDARAKTVQPTRRGIGLAQQAIAAVEQVDEAFFSPVATPTLTRMLRRLNRPTA